MPPTQHLRAETLGSVERAAQLLRGGGLVAFPTETVYGLGAVATSAAAVEEIFAAKGRPHWDPLIVHVAEATQISAVADCAQLSGLVRDRVDRLAEVFWPGPLTMLLPRAASCPLAVTAGRQRVGVRVPAHPVAQALLRATGAPVAAPSANRFGHTSPTTAEHVLADLEGRIDAVLDAGPAVVGVESTVLDPLLTPMVVYRAGAVTVDELAAAAAAPATLFSTQVALDPDASPGALPSPGVGLRHYAPEATLQLTGPSETELREAVAKALARERAPCVLLPAPWRLAPAKGLTVLPWGQWDDPESLAAGLFRALRQAENLQPELILCPLPTPGGLRDALRDRLQKAAQPRSGASATS